MGSKFILAKACLSYTKVMVVPDNTKYKENHSSHHGGMLDYGQTDGHIPTFPDSAIAEWVIILECAQK